MSTNLWTKVNTLSFKTKSTLIAIALGIIPIVPVSGTSVLSATFAGKPDETQSEKLKLALGHQKASFAADITLGLFAAF